MKAQNEDPSAISRNKPFNNSSLFCHMCKNINFDKTLKPLANLIVILKQSRMQPYVNKRIQAINI